MKKVMFMIPNLEGGGAEKVLVDILNNINDTEIDITLILLHKSGPHLDKLNKKIKIKYLCKDNYSCKKKQYRLIKYLPRLYYLIKIREKFDVEIAFLEGLAAKLISNSYNSKSKKVLWIHTDLLKFNWVKDIYKRNEEIKCYKKFDDIVFVSKDAKISFEEKFKDIRNRKSVINNPIIDIDIISKAQEKLIKKNSIPNIVSVGRLIDVKGFDRLIKCHAKLLEKVNHTVTIVGEGKEAEKLKELTIRLGVEKTVNFVGFKTNPYPYINAADIYVCSSRAEGYPLVVAEAIILGKAIISTDITGPREILDNGKYGLLCENSEKGLYKAMRDLLLDNKLLEEYTLKSIERRKKFNYKLTINQIVNLLKS